MGHQRYAGHQWHYILDAVLLTLRYSALDVAYLIKLHFDEVAL